MGRPVLGGFGPASAIVTLAMLVGMAGCGTTGGTRPTGGSSRDDITRSEIELLPDGTAYNLVERFRPRWLIPRSQATPWNPEPTYAMVFLDELLLGSIYALDQISISQIERIEYLNARDATTRYGTGYAGGIIRIVTPSTGPPPDPQQ